MPDAGFWIGLALGLIAGALSSLSFPAEQEESR